jgi:cysteine desulfurase
VKIATEYFGNSSSLHDIGGQSSALLENCREELSSLLGVDKKGLFFTSGGSEGNFLAIEALLSAPKRKGNHIIMGMAEHSSVHGTTKRLENAGYRVTRVPFNSSGMIDQEKLVNLITSETILVSIQHVNSEIGTIQPIENIAGICKANHIHFHSDFVQSFGKIDLTNIAPLVSSFSFSGHKIYGPKGIGGLFIDPAISWSPFFPGGSHEKGLRPGTINVPAIAAMTVAAQKICNQIDEEKNKFLLLRKAFIKTIAPIKKWVQLFQADESSQLPQIIGMRIAGIEGQWMMLECNRLGFAISTGSACQVGMQSPAKAMQAMDLDIREAKEFIRISFGRSTTMDDVLKLGQNIVNVVKEYKSNTVI